MSGDLVLAIDQGTTNTKALVVDGAGDVVASGSVRVPVEFPQPGWVETDATALWGTVERAIEACLDSVSGARIAAIAIADQRESVVIWERSTGRPLGPLVGWQCRRGTAICDDVRRHSDSGRVRATTGLILDPMFSASKARWLLDRIDDGDARAARGELCIGTVDSWLAWNLTGGTAFVTDATNASRTLLLDLDRLTWDAGMLDLFRIPMAALPAVHASSAVVGVTQGRGRLPAGIPVAALIGDSHAALVGHGPPGPASVKATFGTGTSVMAPVAGTIRADRLSATIAWSVEGRDGVCIEATRALEGNITATGAAIAWLATILGRDGGEAEVETLAASVPDAGGVYLVPAFTGLGAPHWDADARGLVWGISRGTSAGHLARAGFDAIAYQVRDVLEELTPALGGPVQALYADGGAIQSDLLAQVTADEIGAPVLRNRSGSLAAMGAAYLAGLAVGIWASLDEVRALPRTVDRFEPRSFGPANADGYAGWRAAVLRSSSELGD